MPFWINILVGLLAFVIAALGGKALLPWLHKLKFGQPIKVDFGPSWHANKQGTPTMGGILFIVGSIVATGVGYVLYRLFGMTDFVSPFSDREALRVLSCLLFCLLFGVIGFIDDFAKVAKKQNEGLKPMQKIVLQVVAAVLWLAAMYWLGDRDTTIGLGFTAFDIKWFYYPLMVAASSRWRTTRCIPWRWQAAVWAFWCGISTRQSALWVTPVPCTWVPLWQPSVWRPTSISP